MAMQEYESKIMQLIKSAAGDGSLDKEQYGLLLESVIEECETRLEAIDA